MSKLNKPQIIEINDFWLVISKPAGWVTNRAQTHQDLTLQDWLESQPNLLDFTAIPSTWEQFLPSDWTPKWGRAEDIFRERSGLAHRLDKETSGVMLVARNPGILMNFLTQFKKQQIQKTYLALCHGLFQLKQDRISLPLARKPSQRLRWSVQADGKLAITNYQVLRSWSQINFSRLQTVAQNQNLLLKSKNINHLYQGFSLVSCLPETGRTHQIRVHLHHLHHPLVGDKTYTSAQKQRIDQIWCPRHFLHAQSLSFLNPASNMQTHTVNSPLASDLNSVLDFLDPESEIFSPT